MPTFLDDFRERWEKKRKGEQAMEMQTSYTFEHTITVGDIYQQDVASITAPEGYELSGEFRPPRDGDVYLSENNWKCVAQDDHGSGHPRLILRPKPKMRTVTIEVPEGEEVFVFAKEREPRMILNNELYYFEGAIYKASRDGDAKSFPLRRLDVK